MNTYQQVQNARAAVTRQTAIVGPARNAVRAAYNAANGSRNAALFRRMFDQIDLTVGALTSLRRRLEVLRNHWNDLEGLEQIHPHPIQQSIDHIRHEIAAIKLHLRQALTEKQRYES